MSGAAGLIVAAPATGSGKTVLTLGILRALARRGIAVASAKVGPDYIDPAFHAAASGRPCRNLDTWAMRPATVAGLAGATAAQAALVVCEGVMGLFDGANLPPGSADGSTADLAAATGWPVVLVADVRGQAGSAAALLRGFCGHRSEIRVSGVIFNRVGAQAHRDMLLAACAHYLPDLPVLGLVPRVDDLALPSRHLGLVQACERPDLEAFIESAAALVEAHVDLDRLIAAAAPAHLPTAHVPPPLPLPPPGQRIAVAADAAFAFAYVAVLEGWRRAGAEVTPFSPVAGEAPPAGCDAIYLPGGYPELHAGRLGPFCQGLRDAAARGAAIYGECGGYMVLGESLTDAAGTEHRMAGLLPLRTSFAQRKLHLGYRQATTVSASALGPAGLAFRGHEFHYATTLDQGGAQPLFHATDAAGKAVGPMGLAAGRVAGSFLHLVDSR